MTQETIGRSPNTAIEAIPRLPEETLATSKSYELSKRILDVMLAVATAVILALPMFAIAIAIKLTSKGPVLHWSKRIGRLNTTFLMPKFRTMRTDAPQLATHLLVNANRYITPVGGFLRKTSLDELPQLFSILKGDLSFVGPRPALFNQHDLTELRTASHIHTLVPGLTGWAQVNGRDELSIHEKVIFEVEYLRHRSLGFDLRILAKSVTKTLAGHGVTH